MTIDLIDYEYGICALDAVFFRKRLDAIHPIIEDGHAAIVDTGINASVPLVQEALASTERISRSPTVWVPRLVMA